MTLEKLRRALIKSTRCRMSTLFHCCLTWRPSRSPTCQSWRCVFCPPRRVDVIADQQGKRRPKRRRNTLKSKQPWGLNLPLFGGIRGPGAVAEEETRGLARDGTDSESSSDDEGNESEDHAAPSSSAVSLPAPEADETPDPVPTDASPSKDPRNRFRMSWGRLMSKGKVPQHPKTPGSATKHNRVPSAEAVDAISTPEPATTATTAPPFASDPPQRRELETKILKQIISEFSAGTFFYSLDFDLTHSLQHKRQLISNRSATGAALADLLSSETATFPPSPTESVAASTGSRNSKASSMDKDDFIEPDVQVPLWRRADRRFFWNEWLCKDFIELGLHGYIIPVMQGWVQSASFSVPVPPNPLEPNVSLGSVPVDIGVISRRSRDRAGLRYQRRGIDDQGHVANMVETEMIVRAKVSNSSRDPDGGFDGLTFRSRVKSRFSALFRREDPSLSNGHNRHTR